VHARFHDAFADGLRVAESGEMADGVEVHRLSREVTR
jgi:hypothetical protein